MKKKNKKKNKSCEYQLEKVSHKVAAVKSDNDVLLEKEKKKQPSDNIALRRDRRGKQRHCQNAGRHFLAERTRVV